MSKKLNLCTGEIDMFADKAAGDTTDFITCEAISPHPVLYTPDVWRRWERYMRRQADVFIQEWAHNNPVLLAILMRNARELSRYDLRRIRTPNPLRPWHTCQDENARWSVSIEGAQIHRERRMIDRLAAALDAMGKGGHA